VSPVPTPTLPLSLVHSYGAFSWPSPWCPDSLTVHLVPQSRQASRPLQGCFFFFCGSSAVAKQGATLSSLFALTPSSWFPTSHQPLPPGFDGGAAAPRLSVRLATSTVCDSQVVAYQVTQRYQCNNPTPCTSSYPCPTAGFPPQVCYRCLVPPPVQRHG